MDSLGNRFEYHSDRRFQEWPLAGRIAVAALGIWILRHALREKGLSRSLFALTGAAFFTRALANRELAEILGILLSPTIHLERSMKVEAPPEEVYAFWSNFSNYPLFMSFIHKVEINEQGGLAWTAIGPGRMPLHWNSELTAFSPTQGITWSTLRGSPFQNIGRVQFLPLESGMATRVRISLSYSVPAGGLGYAAAHFLGFDPRDRIDEDMDTMRQLIEKNRYEQLPRERMAK